VGQDRRLTHCERAVPVLLRHSRTAPGREAGLPLALGCLALGCLALACLALGCLALACLALGCLALGCLGSFGEDFLALGLVAFAPFAPLGDTCGGEEEGKKRGRKRKWSVSTNEQVRSSS